MPEVHVLKEMEAAYPTLMTPAILDKFSSHIESIGRKMKRSQFQN